MSDNDTFIYMDNSQDTRRNKNRFWLSKKGRDIGNSQELDQAIEAWIWSNNGYGHRGLIVVDTAIGYTWGTYPGTEEGVEKMKCDLGGRKIWSTYEDGDDFHIILWGKVRDPQPQGYCKPKATASRNVRGRAPARGSTPSRGRASARDRPSLGRRR